MKSLPLAPLCLLATLACAAVARAGETAPAPAPPAPAAASPAVASPAAAATHAFEGIWMFDARRSDDPRKIMESSRGGSGRRPEGGIGEGGMGGGGMRHGGMRRGGMGEGGGEGMGRGPAGDDAEGAGPEAGGSTSRGGGDPRRAMQRVFNPPKKMVVYVDHDRFQVEDDEGAPRVYTLADSLKAAGVNPLDGEATVRTRGHSLEAKQPLGRRGALIETYELSADGRTLTIRAHREGGPEGMPNPVFTRVYTKYEGE